MVELHHAEVGPEVAAGLGDLSSTRKSRISASPAAAAAGLSRSRSRGPFDTGQQRHPCLLCPVACRSPAAVMCPRFRRPRPVRGRPVGPMPLIYPARKPPGVLGSTVAVRW